MSVKTVMLALLLASVKAWDAVSDVAELAEVARTLSVYRIVPHDSSHLASLVITCEEYPPEPHPLPAASYYVAEVNDGQRAVYDQHCAERFAQRSPYHYTSTEDVAIKAEIGGSIWRARAVHEIPTAFVAIDGLVIQPGGSPTRPGNVFTLERPPGFNGLGRLLIAAERLGLANIMEDGSAAVLRPFDLTPARFAHTYQTLQSELPKERGIENVHAFTYAKTFRTVVESNLSDAVMPGGKHLTGDNNVGDGLSAHKCLFVLEQVAPPQPSKSVPSITLRLRPPRCPTPKTTRRWMPLIDDTECWPQFWTVNYWHWATNALPKALIFRDRIEQSHPGCRILAYDFPWTSEYLKLLGYDHRRVVRYDPRALYFGCRVLLPSPSALDGANRRDLMMMRTAVLPHAPAVAAAAAAAAGVGTRRPLVLLHLRYAGDSVHGDGRSLTNLPLVAASLRHAFHWTGDGTAGDGARVDAPEVALFDPSQLTVAEQVSLYNRAAVVIGVHGAGFANLLWASEGCEVVEIVPIDVHLDFQCGLTPFWVVSELLGLRKHAFIVYSGRMFEAFELPLVEFVAFLTAVGILPWKIKSK